MIERHRRVAARTRAELSELERAVQRAQEARREYPQSGHRQYLLDSVALNLHSFYRGTERVFQLVAAELDEQTSSGEAWHLRLLHQMAREVAEVRPAVITPETVPLLDEVRKFRHFIRNAYTTQLDPKRMETVMNVLPDVWPSLQSQLLAFADFLDRLSRADELPD